MYLQKKKKNRTHQGKAKEFYKINVQNKEKTKLKRIEILILNSKIKKKKESFFI